MLHLLDIRDALDDERFVQVQLDPQEENLLGDQKVEDGGDGEVVGGSLATIPTPTLPGEMYKEPAAQSFRVRGPTYLDDKVKVASGPYLFRLVCCDLFEVPGSTTNICSHPKNRVYRALQRNEDVWVFAVNIMIPGPPYLSFVAYFQGDKVRVRHPRPRCPVSLLLGSPCSLKTLPSDASRRSSSLVPTTSTGTTGSNSSPRSVVRSSGLAWSPGGSSCRWWTATWS